MVRHGQLFELPVPWVGKYFNDYSDIIFIKSYMNVFFYNNFDTCESESPSLHEG